MKKLYRILLVLLAGAVFLACNDDIDEIDTLPSENDEYAGGVNIFKLGEETAEFLETDVRCYIMTEKGDVIVRTSKHTRIKDSSEVVMKVGLKDGLYRLLYFEFDLPKKSQSERIKTSQHGLGGRIRVANGQITLIDSYNATMGFSGEGTEENPYAITSAKHLERLENIVNGTLTNKNVNNSTYFAQYADIDVWELCWDSPDGFGWYPIGFTNVLPFRGHYNGNGYAIKGLYAHRNLTSGVGLFGFVHNAEIDGVVLDGAEIYGLYATGGIAGAVLTAPGVRDASTINNCKVINSIISGSQTNDSGDDVDTWSMAIGGIVGTVDAKALFTANGCSVDSKTIVSGANCVGGILGCANMYSTIQIASCTNSAQIKAAYSAVGGIVGSADTVTIVACKNLSSVTGAIKYAGAADGNGNSGVSAGGIIGASGVAAITACINSGDVKGNDGVGGMIGSTRIGNDEARLYNTASLRYCLNSGKIAGNNYVAGMCGESQFTGYALCNNGSIDGGGECIAGIIGYSPAAGIINCVNGASVTGKEYVSGIVGQAIWGSLAVNQNYGKIKSRGNYAAGIVALTGDNIILNYCENAAPVDGEGSEAKVGGIVGEFGLPSEWTPDRIASVVIGSLEVVTAGIVSPVASVVIDDFVTNKILIFCSKVAMGLFYLPADLHFFGSGVYNLVNHTEAEKIEEANKAAMQELSTKVNDKIDELRKDEAKWPEYEVYIEDIKRQLESEDQAKIDSLNQQLNNKRNAMAADVEHKRETQALVHTIIGGCCIVVGTVASIVAAIPTGGSSLLGVVTGIATVAGIGAGVVGGANGIIQGCLDYTYNANVVTQCVNRDTISARNSSNGFVGGIVGSMNQYSLLSDCLNVGDCNAPSANRGQIAGGVNQEVQILNSLALGTATGWNGFADANSGKLGVDYEGLYYYFSNNGSVSGNYSEQGSGLSDTELGKSSSYKEWSIGGNSSLWIIQSNTSPAYPIPYNSEAM